MKEIHDRCAEAGEEDQKKKSDAVSYVDGANLAGFKKVGEVMLSYRVF